MVVGVGNPRSASNDVNGFEENTMAILDSASAGNSRDALDDKLTFLEAVRATALVSDSPTAPSWKMFDAIFQILKGSSTLELAMASYQLLIDLDKNFPRISLKNSHSPKSSLEPASTVEELVVDKEAWAPFCLGSEASRSSGEGTSRNSHHVDSLKFCTLIEELCEAVNKRDSQLLVQSAVNMLLFQYLISVLETDFLLRHSLHKVTQEWVLLRESLLSMLLASRRLNVKSLVRDCMSIICKQNHQKTVVKFRDLQSAKPLTGSEKTAEWCDVALAMAVPPLKGQTCTSVQKILTMIMELDVAKKEADLYGITSRADGIRTPVLDIIVDELTYAKDRISSFLKVFSDETWKLQIILQYISKFSPKSSIRTRRSNDSPKEATFDDVLNYFSSPSSTKAIAKKIGLRDSQLLLAHGFLAYLSVYRDNNLDNTKMVGSRNLKQICNGLISAFENIRKLDEGLEMASFEKGALFTASTIASQ